MINKDDKVFFLNVPEKKKFLLDFSRRADIRNPVMYIHLKNGDIVELTLSGNLKIPKEIEGFKEILKNINYEVIIMTCGIRYERGDITITYNKIIFIYFS